MSNLPSTLPFLNELEPELAANIGINLNKKFLVLIPLIEFRNVKQAYSAERPEINSQSKQVFPESFTYSVISVQNSEVG